jgi:hypothetical protein
VARVASSGHRGVEVFLPRHHFTLAASLLEAIRGLEVGVALAGPVAEPDGEGFLDEGRAGLS